MDEDEALLETLEALRDEHRILDQEVALLQNTANAGLLEIARLKKRKLALKDRITFIEDQLHPDIIA